MSVSSTKGGERIGSDVENVVGFVDGNLSRQNSSGDSNIGGGADAKQNSGILEEARKEEGEGAGVGITPREQILSEV
jgi:hypothetical protein